MNLALLLLGLAQQDPALQKELEKALEADKAAAAAQKPEQQPATAPLPRGAQSLNPDISVILDADFGVQRRAPQFLNGDDPDLHAEGGRHAVGLTAQEVELAASAIVDPYFRGDV